MKGFEVGFSSRKRMRDSNQDVPLIHPIGDGVLLVVCDGMGGAEGGGRAARVCAEAIRDHVAANAARAARSLELAILAGHDAVRAEAQRLDVPGIGTTAAVAYVRAGHLNAAWAGDSRIGLLDASGFTWLSEDHVDRPGSHLLTQAAGIGDSLRPSVLEPRELGPGDTVMLCSDGVHGHVVPSELFEILSLHSPDDALARIDLVLDRRAAEDNSTAVVLRMDESYAEQPTVEITKTDLEVLDPPRPAPDRTVLVLVGVLGVLALIALSILLAQRLGVPL